MVKLKLRLLYIILLLSSVCLHGQIQEKIVAPSPTAANLGVYGEIPVSYFTGTPSIQVPIYEISNKNITVPVSLSYHPGGIRPNIHPGPTGLGWSLNAGGIISRTKKGALVDEYFEIVNKDTTQRGYYYSTSKLNTSDWKTFYESKTCKGLQDYADRYCDLEPDEFSFSFLGISGKFYFSSTGAIKVQCDKPISVIFDKNDMISPRELGIKWPTENIKTFRKFTIIDEFGNKYIFGNGAIEFSCPIPTIYEDPGMYSSLLEGKSWYLKEIQPADGSSKINFEYEQGPIISQIDWFYLKLVVNIKDLGKLVDYENTRDNSPCRGSFIYPVYLKRITRDTDLKIEFSYSKSMDLKYGKDDYAVFQPNSASLGGFSMYNFEMFPQYSYYKIENYDYPEYLNMVEWRKLDTIKIFSSTAKIKEIQFSYLENAQQRLFLEQVTLGDKMDANAPKYKFEYKDRNKLCAYNETRTDVWGYYYGKRLSSTFNLGVDTTYFRSGVLNKIIFPTGGSSSFEYELNWAQKTVDKNDRAKILAMDRHVGGLRIKSIKSNDVNGKIINKEFYYSPDYLDNELSKKSSGVQNIEPEFSFTRNNIPNCYAGQYFSYSEEHGDPIIPLTSHNDGCYIGYTTVTEVTKDGTSTNGYKQYTFSNHDNGYNDDSALKNWNIFYFWDMPFNSRFFERGHLIKEVTFNNNKKIIAKTQITRSIIGTKSEDDNVRALKYGCFLNDPNLALFSSTAYLNYVYKSLVTEKKETAYRYNTASSDSVITTTSYTYNPNGILKSETTNNSSGENISINYQYPSDFATVSPYKEMIAANILSPVITKSTLKGSTTLMTESSDYTFYNSKFYKPVNSKWLKSGMATAEVRATYSYDDRGNVREMINGGEKTVYIWGYNYQYPIAEIKGATYDEVTAKIPDASLKMISEKNAPIAADMTTIGGLRTSLPNALVTTYTYKPLVGVETMTDPRGVVTTYEYDTFSRLSKTKHNGQTINTYQYNYKTQ